jgi:RNA polymerase sigma factor (sigma-70 family)
MRSLAAPPDADSDADLLGRFSQRRDESAFAALVSRHGAMVFGVCRRVLRDSHAAEDASQATFMVLARKAGSVRRPHTLAAWLHGVAYRVAMKARTAARRRGEYPSGRVPDTPDGRDEPLAVISARDLLEIFEGELQALPQTYRLPLVLCCLEGYSQEEAAESLGCSAASIRGRLERGRKRLHERLARRGLALSAALAAVETSRVGAAAPLVGATVRAALAFAAGSGRGVVSQQVITLAEGGLRTMFWSKMKMALVVLATVGLSGIGVTWLAATPRQPEPPAKVPKVVALADEAPKPAPPEDRAKNSRYFIFPVKTDLQRELVPEGTDIFVLLDASASLVDSKIDLSKLDLAGLEKELSPHKAAPKNLHMTLSFSERLLESRHHTLIHAMTGFGYGIGFAKFGVFTSVGPKVTTWKERTDDFTRKPRQPGGDEKATADKLVKAYPVRTELSRHFTADADCVVVVLPSLEKDKGTIPQPVRDAIADAVGKLGKIQKKRISFVASHLKSPTDQQLMVTAFYKLAEDLGFETSLVTLR